MEHLCKNCNKEFTGNYCSNCGQKFYTEKDKNLQSIFEEVLHFMTHFEGTLFTTLKTILLQPGKLSFDYCSGMRKKYYKPISFFMLLVVIYLLFPVMQGLNMQLHFYKGLPLSGSLIAHQIETKMAAMHISELQLAEIFHHKSEKTSKILLFLLIPLTASAMQLMYFYKKKPAFDYFIIATEINNFIILFYFLLTPLVAQLVFKLFGFIGLPENALMIAIALSFFIYITVALRHFFGDSWLKSFGKGLLFALFYGIITQIIYKTILFEVTFALI
jgi:hypothetical protein